MLIKNKTNLYIKKLWFNLYIYIYICIKFFTNKYVKSVNFTFCKVELYLKFF